MLKLEKNAASAAHRISTWLDRSLFIICGAHSTAIIFDFDKNAVCCWRIPLFGVSFFSHVTACILAINFGQIIINRNIGTQRNVERYFQHTHNEQNLLFTPTTHNTYMFKVCITTFAKPNSRMRDYFCHIINNIGIDLRVWYAAYNWFDRIHTMPCSGFGFGLDWGGIFKDVFHCSTDSSGYIEIEWTI